MRGGIAARGGKNNLIQTPTLKTGKYTFSKTVMKHFREIQKKQGWNHGKPNRPYMSSPLTIQEIISNSQGVPDQFIKGGLKYTSTGKSLGRQGTWELVIHPKENKIYHFFFNPKKK